MVVISHNQAKQLMENNNVFLVITNGGLGNKYGMFFSAIDLYFRCNLQKTHLFMCMSHEDYMCELNDYEVFTANDKIVFVESLKVHNPHSIPFDSFHHLPFGAEPHTLSQLDLTHRHLLYNNNILQVDKSSIKQALGYFDIQIQPQLKQNVQDFIRLHNIDKKRTLGIHIRATDTPDHISCHRASLIDKMVSIRAHYKNAYVCSDESQLEAEVTAKVQGIPHPKKFAVTKLPGCEHLPWSLTLDETEQVMTILGYHTQYNVCRRRDHCLEALNDLLILAHCDTSPGEFLYTSFLRLGIFLVEHFFTPSLPASVIQVEVGVPPRIQPITVKKKANSFFKFAYRT
jgi:hypothetical protein